MSDNTRTKSLTPYQAHKVVNAALAEAGLDTRIPPQMMYNYTSGRINKGKAPLIETTTVADQVRIVPKALAAWTKQYVANKVAQAAEQAEADETPAEGADNESASEGASTPEGEVVSQEA
jgi:hypothetical protein